MRGSLPSEIRRIAECLPSSRSHACCHQREHGAIRALNPRTGDRVWEYKLHTKPWAGVLSTAGKLVFGGSDEGHVFALDAETGEELWRMNTGGLIRANAVSYLSKGKQVVAIAAGNSIFTFDLGE